VTLIEKKRFSSIILTIHIDSISKKQMNNILKICKLKHLYLIQKKIYKNILIKNLSYIDGMLDQKLIFKHSKYIKISLITRRILKNKCDICNKHILLYWPIKTANRTNTKIYQNILNWTWNDRTPSQWR